MAYHLDYTCPSLGKVLSMKYKYSWSSLLRVRYLKAKESHETFSEMGLNIRADKAPLMGGLICYSNMIISSVFLGSYKSGVL